MPVFPRGCDLKRAALYTNCLVSCIQISYYIHAQLDLYINWKLIAARIINKRRGKGWVEEEKKEKSTDNFPLLSY